jgi:hypothetical protein
MHLLLAPILVPVLAPVLTPFLAPSLADTDADVDALAEDNNADCYRRNVFPSERRRSQLTNTPRPRCGGPEGQIGQFRIFDIFDNSFPTTTSL